MYSDTCYHSMYFSPSLPPLFSPGIDLLRTCDLVFSQCLTSVVTSVAHHLVKASKGHLNPGVEYESENQETSMQWLQMVAKKGVLIHLQSTMIPKEVGVGLLVPSLSDEYA